MIRDELPLHRARAAAVHGDGEVVGGLNVVPAQD
jgi:hypothetical protein